MKNIALFLLIALFAVSCEKEVVIPDYSTKAQVAVVDEDLTISRDPVWMQAKAQYFDLVKFTEGIPMPPKGIDTTANVKARLALWPGTGSSYQWLVFDLSISDSNATAPLNAMSVVIEYTGNYTPAQGAGFVHNLTPYSINWNNGVLLENSVGNFSYIAWYSLSPYYIASSTGGSAGVPIVCAIPVYGNSGTITFGTCELSKDGYNNYIVDARGINQ